MAQHDIDIANASGAGVRSDINLVLNALVTNHSGASPPSVTFSYQYWADTTSNTLKRRNGANSAWVLMGSLDAPNMGLATLASPVLTGNPRSTTPTASDNSTKIATTAMVQAAAAAKVAAHNTIHTILNGTNTVASIHIKATQPTSSSDGDIWFEY